MTHITNSLQSKFLSTFYQTGSSITNNITGFSSYILLHFF